MYVTDTTSFDKWKIPLHYDFKIFFLVFVLCNFKGLSQYAIKSKIIDFYDLFLRILNKDVYFRTIEIW